MTAKPYTGKTFRYISPAVAETYFFDYPPVFVIPFSSFNLVL